MYFFEASDVAKETMLPHVDNVDDAQDLRLSAYSCVGYSVEPANTKNVPFALRVEGLQSLLFSLKEGPCLSSIQQCR